MKIRKGFVSNSSSTSFTCDVCGTTECGMDVCLEDVEMVECECHHTFCEAHLLAEKKELESEEKRARLIKYFDRSTYYREMGKVEETKKLTDDELEDTWQDWKYELNHIQSNNCPCCQLISPTDSDIMKYVESVMGKNKEEIIKDMKEKYGTLDNMEDQLK